MTFHPHVEGIKRYYLEVFTDDECSETARKLTTPNDKIDITLLERMWGSIERAQNSRGEHMLDDDLWVHCFIGAAHRASSFPAYYYKNKKERTELTDEIKSLADKLSNILKANSLDFHLTHSKGKIFNGFYFYEGFSEKNQWYIDQEENNKLPISVLLEALSEQTKEDISYAHTTAKAGSTVKETRFIRSLSQSNIDAFRTPLHSVTSIATQAIFDTVYTESDIANLLNRNVQNECRSEAVQRLARLPKSEYELVRGAEAAKLKWHTSTLDDEIKKNQR